MFKPFAFGFDLQIKLFHSMPSLASQINRSVFYLYNVGVLILRPAFLVGGWWLWPFIGKFHAGVF